MSYLPAIQASVARCSLIASLPRHPRYAGSLQGPPVPSPTVLRVIESSGNCLTVIAARTQLTRSRASSSPQRRLPHLSQTISKVRASDVSTVEDSQRNPQFEIGVMRKSARLTPSAPSVMYQRSVTLYELGGYMSNTLLRDTDQMSMAHALEVRVPFVDPEVVNFVLALPGEWKMNGGRPKPLLVDALGDLLPEEIWRRPKMGFTLPFQRWMQSGLAAEIDETFSARQHLTRVGIEPDHARSVWQAFKKNPQHEPWSRPWALYVLAKWCELNNVSL